MSEERLNKLVTAALLAFIFVSCAAKSGYETAFFVLGWMAYFGCGFYVGGAIFASIMRRKVLLDTKYVLASLAFVVMWSALSFQTSVNLASLWAAAYVFIGFFLVGVVYFFSYTKVGVWLWATEEKFWNAIISRIKSWVTRRST
ncbi:hypothetical protein ATO7_08882 [Oceanococcus atlanticus]|uniref:Lipoprotein n=1 Tax=Oceanococcus atlanticus TaxID=1317117 RepID=A0A1Y1SF31_9GAMM|nr:hypothetical protein [Oceanococcus atlanticus]ORE87142.1 hypothetical protein ATO7_08882 [Oceanococcus atlanticus]